MTPLAELAALFLRLGLTAFGGPAVHVSMMHEEVVRRRGWLSEERFVDLVGATNLIPGPNSTELALHIGWDRRGVPGLLVAGLCFVSPAVLLTAALAWAYLRFGSLPAAGWRLDGVKPAMLVVVAQALIPLGRKALKTPALILLAAASASAVILGATEWMVLSGAAAFAVLASRVPGDAAPLVALGAPAVSPLSVFWVFLKTGSLLFGSGYVLLAFMRTDLVQQRHWLSETQLLDAIAAGQVTPGPVFSTATFAGWLLAGPLGAVAATVGIFLPAFVLVGLTGPLVPKLRASKTLGDVLDAVNAASLALMGVVTVELGHAALTSAVSVLIFGASALLAVRFRWGSTRLLALGAGASVALRLSGLG